MASSDPFEPRTRIDAWLADVLDDRRLPPPLHDAIRYAVLSPGKRLRPLLAIRCAEAAGGEEIDALPAAAAVELIHAFSLVHDDLPALDDDDLRRGHPTLHRHAGEAMAILAGDAMQGLAFELVLERIRPGERALAVARELTHGCNEMIAGQVYDTVGHADPDEPPLAVLERIHRGKTGALIRAACRMGAICGDASPERLERLSRYGEAIGQMFQVVDDLLDVTQSTEQLGKTAGKDAAQSKLTYPSLMGIEATRETAARLGSEAREALDGLGPDSAEPLRVLCRYLETRTR